MPLGRRPNGVHLCESAASSLIGQVQVLQEAWKWSDHGPTIPRSRHQHLDIVRVWYKLLHRWQKWVRARKWTGARFETCLVVPLSLPQNIFLTQHYHNITVQCEAMDYVEQISAFLFRINNIYYNSVRGQNI